MEIDSFPKSVKTAKAINKIAKERCEAYAKKRKTL